MNLQEKAVKGVVWSAIEKWGTQAISFLVFLVLARLLEPETFGLVAMASVFTAFVQAFLDQGLAQAIVQRADLEREHLDTAFWINVLTGSMLTVGGMLLSGAVAALYDEPRLAPVVAWLSLTFLLASLSSTQQAILQRELNFKSLATRTLVARISGGCIGIGAALFGFGIWSLVAQSLIGGLVGVIVLWRVSDWRPRFRFSTKHFRELFGFGINIIGNNILAFFDLRIDDFLIGYFLGPTMLGYYVVAYNLLQRMLLLLNGIAGAVIFPIFSRLQQEPERLRQMLYQVTEFAMLIATPLFIGVVVLAPELTIVLFGPQWMPSIPIMQVLALASVLRVALAFFGQLIIALGEPNRLLRLKFLATLVRVIAFALALQWGIVAVATTFALSVYVVAPFYFWLAHKMVILDFKVYFSQYTVALLGSLAMAATVLGLKYVQVDFVGLYGQFIVYILAGILVYLTVVHLARPSLSRQLVSLVRLVLPSWALSTKQ